MSNRTDINSLLLEMRSIRNQIDAFSGSSSINTEGVKGLARPEDVGGPKFGNILSQAVNKVNDIQHASGAASRAYVQGDPGVDITDVMIASQKSSVAFQAMTQVRNKVVEAYKDVMNMPL